MPERPNRPAPHGGGGGGVSDVWGGGLPYPAMAYGCLPRLAGAPLAIRSRFSAMLHYYTPEYEFVLE